MKRSKYTGRALLAIVLCFAMLAGSTMAWFTDSVTNTGNTIQAGDLQVGFNYRALTSEDAYTSVPSSPQETGKLFTDQLWEPGYSYGYDFEVVNNGSLALKWELSIQNIQAGAENVNLADVLDVYVVDVDAQNLEGATAKGTLSDLENGVVCDGELNKKDDVSRFSVVLKMKDEADNTYKGSSLTFDVYLRATQDDFEKDGFDNSDYDASAAYEQVNVSYDGNKSPEENGKALMDAVETAPEGAVVYVDAGSYVTTNFTDNGADRHHLMISNDNVTIIGEPGTVINAKFQGSYNGNEQQTVLITGDNVTLKNLTINPIDGYANKTVEIRDASNTVIENCVINGNLYIGGSETGAYTIRNNTINDDEVSIAVCNGAGNAMTTGEEAVISGNICEGALYLTGTRTTGWDLAELNNLPKISGNTFGSCTQNVNGTDYSSYIRVASTDQSRLAAVSVEDIQSNNSFDGKPGTDWSFQDVEDTTGYAGTWYRFYN